MVNISSLSHIMIADCKLWIIDKLINQISWSTIHNSQITMISCIHNAYFKIFRVNLILKSEISLKDWKLHHSFLRVTQVLFFRMRFPSKKFRSTIFVFQTNLYVPIIYFLEQSSKLEAGNCERSTKNIRICL